MTTTTMLRYGTRNSRLIRSRPPRPASFREQQRNKLEPHSTRARRAGITVNLVADGGMHNYLQDDDGALLHALYTRYRYSDTGASLFHYPSLASGRHALSPSPFFPACPINPPLSSPTTKCSR